MRVLEPFAAQPRRARLMYGDAVVSEGALHEGHGVPYFPRRALLDADGRIVWSD